MKKLFLLIALAFLLSPSLFAAEPFKLVYHENYAPRSWDDQGQMKGIIIDIIDEVLVNKMNLKVQHSGYPWLRAQLMVKNKLADAFVTVPTEERKTYTEISEQPVLKFELFVATQPDNPRLEEIKNKSSIQEFKDVRIVDYLGNGWAKRALKNMKVYWVPEISKVYPFLYAKKADVLFVSDRGVFDLEKFGFKDKLMVLKKPIVTLPFHLCIGKHSKLLPYKDTIDKHLKELWDQGFIKSVHQKYYQE
jgi:polar amino acid transport system substrate-binding protein